MSKKAGLWLILATLATLTGCARAYDVHRVSTAANGPRFASKAIFYALPRTVVTAQASVTKTQIRPGGCSGQATLLAQLGVDQATQDLLTDLLSRPTSEQVAHRYKISDFQLGSRAEADPSQVFAVEVKGKTLQNQLLELQLSETGMLLSGKNEAENRAAQFATQTFSTIASLAVKASMGRAAAPDGSRCAQLRTQIENVRERQRQLVSPGGTPSGTPKDTLELMLSKLKEEETDLMTHFTGPREVTLGDVRCEVRPKERFQADSNQVNDFELEITTRLFQFSRTLGLVNLDPGCIVPTAFQGSGADTNAQDVNLVTQAVSNHYSRTVAARQQEPRETGGYFYRVPGEAVVRLNLATDPKVVLRMPVAQYGVVATLPGSADLNAILEKYEAAFFPATGGLQKFATTTQAPDTTAITNIGTGLGAILDAEAAERATEKAAEDELAQLERRRKILEEQKKIRDLEAAQPVAPADQPPVP